MPARKLPEHPDRAAQGLKEEGTMRHPILLAAMLALAAAGVARAEDSPAQDVKEGAHEVGHGVKNAAHSVGHGVKSGASSVGHGIKEGAVAVGHATRDTA